MWYLTFRKKGYSQKQMLLFALWNAAHMLNVVRSCEEGISNEITKAIMDAGEDWL